MNSKNIFRKSRTPYIFLVLTMLAFLLAEIFPWIGGQEGSPLSYITGKYVAVAIIFFLYGLSMKATTTRKVASSWKVMLFVQIFNFIFIPIFVRLVVTVFSLLGSMDEWIINGFTTMACMPPPLCSAFILTKVAGGSEEIALVNSAIGSVLGIFLTPALLLIHRGTGSTIPVLRTLLWLLVAGFAPVVLGRIVRLFPWPSVHTQVKEVVWNAALLIAIFTSFCDVFQQREFTVTAAEFLVIVIIVIVVQICLVILSVRLVTFFHSIDEHTAVAVLFCSTHKSLTLGLPIVKTLFGGYAHVSHMALPLLVYHPVQLILGSIMAPTVLGLCAQYSKKTPYLPT